MPKFDNETGKQAGKKSSRAGIPNKDVSGREWIKSFLEDYRKEKWKEDFYSLTPGERQKIAVKLMEYDVPKLRSMELLSDFSNLTDSDLDKIIEGLKQQQ